MFLKKIFCVLLLLAANLMAGGYFQQGVSYQINAELNPANHFITLKSVMNYVNNSPDTLKEIYIGSIYEYKISY